MTIKTQMRHTLICTVGTSLFNNLKFNNDEIGATFRSQNWNKLVLLLLDQPSTERICGAEINSITSICREKLIGDRIRLILLVSDTDDGLKTGNLLKLYYENLRNDFKFEQVEVKLLKGLRDDDVKAFKQQGLKNLVQEISSQVRSFSPSGIAINATGGYKAQISFAGMIGQALEIPVYYLFEKFSSVIDLPPQPIALDLGFWLSNYNVFESLEAEQMLVSNVLGNAIDKEYFSSLLDREKIDGVDYVSLSAMGILFHERSRLQFTKQETTLLSLIPQDHTVPDRKPIQIGDHHGRDVLREFAQKIRRSPYVTKIINSLPYNSHSRNPIRKTDNNGIVEFVLTWTDEGFGLSIQTTGRNLIETNTIALHLVEKFT